MLGGDKRVLRKYEQFFGKCVSVFDKRRTVTNLLHYSNTPLVSLSFHLWAAIFYFKI